MLCSKNHKLLDQISNNILKLKLDRFFQLLARASSKKTTIAEESSTRSATQSNLKVIIMYTALNI